MAANASNEPKAFRGISAIRVTISRSVEHFLDSLEKVRGEKIDITLGNHTAQNDTVGKYERWMQNPDGPNPFIDPEEWERFIVSSENNYKRMLEEEEAGTDQEEL